MTSNERSPLTPQQRLAISRRALVRQLHGGEARERGGHTALDGDNDDDLEYAHQASLGESAHEQRPSRKGNVWGGVARSVVQRWWRRHPAHAMGQLARPLLGHYARKEPAKLMAAAAAIGALLVLVKPWRLLSVTAVLAAVLKTSDLADVVNTVMQKTPSPPRKDTP